MNTAVKSHIQKVLHHLYINPLEKCNLRCKICYTRKTSPILKKEEIISFVKRYNNIKKVETITFCGGEVFTLPFFPLLVNHFTSQNIFIQIITNGTIDKLEQIKLPNSVNLIVSVDGLRKDHDQNRGEGNFDKSIHFLKKAHDLGFHTEIFSIVSQKNLHKIDLFEKKLKNLLGYNINITYHPRKPPSYLLHHPISNIFGDTKGFEFLTDKQMIAVMKKRNVFPPKNLGCYQISLVSDGRIFGCCEGTIPLGVMTEPVTQLIDKLYNRVQEWENINTLTNCLGCSQPEFMCGIKKYLILMEKTNQSN